MGINDIFSVEHVVLDLNVKDKRDLLQKLSTELASRFQYSEHEVLEALLARERLGSTALGRGVALPHARLPGDILPAIIFARLHRPIDFEAKDDEPVDLVFLVLWPEASAEGFLATLSGICVSLRDSQVLRKLRAAKVPEDVVTTLLRPPPSSAMA